jgi:hypothetical protein
MCPKQLVLTWGASLLAITAAAFPAGAASGPCDGRAAEVRDSGVVVVERAPTDGRGVAIEACGRVAAPPAAVWPVLVNCDAFQDFLPSVESSKGTPRGDDSFECETWIDLPFPLEDLHSVTLDRKRVLDGGGFRRDWTLLRGNYARNIGAWTVLPWPGEADETLLVYTVDIDPDNFIPDFILRRIQSGTAPEVFDAVRGRVAWCDGNRGEPACRIRSAGH